MPPAKQPQPGADLMQAVSALVDQISRLRRELKQRDILLSAELERAREDRALLLRYGLRPHVQKDTDCDDPCPPKR